MRDWGKGGSRRDGGRETTHTVPGVSTAGRCYSRLRRKEYHGKCPAGEARFSQRNIQGYRRGARLGGGAKVLGWVDVRGKAWGVERSGSRSFSLTLPVSLPLLLSMVQRPSLPFSLSPLLPLSLPPSLPRSESLAPSLGPSLPPFLPHTHPPNLPPSHPEPSQAIEGTWKGDGEPVGLRLPSLCGKREGE